MKDLKVYFEKSASAANSAFYGRFGQDPCNLNEAQLNATNTKSADFFSSWLHAKNQVQFDFKVESLVVPQSFYKDLSCQGKMEHLRERGCDNNTPEIVFNYFLESLKDSIDLTTNCCLENLSILEKKEECKKTNYTPYIIMGTTATAAIALSAALFLTAISLCFSQRNPTNNSTQNPTATDIGNITPSTEGNAGA